MMQRGSKVRPSPRWFPILVLILAQLGAGGAAAGPLRLFGFDASSRGSGNSQGAIGRGIGAVLSNPALLTDLPDLFTVQAGLYRSSLFADVMPRPTATEVPITYYDSDVGIQGEGLDRPLPTSELRVPRHDQRIDDAAGFIGLGLAHSLGFEGFKLGLMFHMPVTGLASLNTAYPDERDQYFGNTVHFARFGEWGKMLVGGGGIAYAPFEWISFGVAAEVALAADLVIDMYVPEATVQEYALVNGEIEAVPSVRFVGGLKGRPLEWLHLGVTFRDRRFMEVGTDAKLTLWNYHEASDRATILNQIKQQHNLAIDYEPLEVSAAVGVQFEKIWAQATVTWSHWENYFDQHRQHPEDAALFLDDNEPRCYAPQEGDVCPTLSSGYGDDFRFHDTATVRVGAGYEYLEGFELLAGFGYFPSPVPDQVGRTSYVDNHLLLASLGHRFEFTILESRFSADIGLQFWHMLEITVHKDPAQVKDEFADRAKGLTTGKAMAEAAGLQTNNPGFPGYRAGGWLFSASAALTYHFGVPAESEVQR